MHKGMIQMEYNNIKYEIATLMQRCDNLLTTMYTVSITLMGLGFQLKNKYFFMMILIFIIPIQGLINIRRYHMARCSVYIKKYICSKYKELKWESIVGMLDLKFRESYSKENRLYRFTTAIIGSGTIIIALVAIISYLQNSIFLTNFFKLCFPFLLIYFLKSLHISYIFYYNYYIPLPINR